MSHFTPAMSKATAVDIHGNAVDVPLHYVCPLTKQVFRKPLMTRHGQNFERFAILNHLATDVRPKCPVTRTPLTVSDLLPNRHLEAQIVGWRRRCEIADPESSSRKAYNRANQKPFVGNVSLSQQQKTQGLCNKLLEKKEPTPLYMDLGRLLSRRGKDEKNQLLAF